MSFFLVTVILHNRCLADNTAMCHTVSAPLDEQVGDVLAVDALIFSQTKDSFLMLNKKEPVVSEV